MRKYFSKRHEESIESKKLELSIPQKLRTSILRILSDHSKRWYDEIEGPCNMTFDATEEKLKTFYGETCLRAYSSDNSDRRLVPSDFSGVLERGYPARVLDAIEAFCDELANDDRIACEKQLNESFENHHSHWRIINSTFFLIDSEYIREEIIVNTQMLFRENSMQGALDEFGEAVSCLNEGQTKNAVVAAHKSVESAMKTVLEIKDHATFGQLLERLIKSGIIPKYYEEFLVHFEKLALGVVKERNRPGTGHGQGAERKELPRSLAELSVHIAAVFNYFITKRWLESKENSAPF